MNFNFKGIFVIFAVLFVLASFFVGSLIHPLGLNVFTFGICLMDVILILFFNQQINDN